MLVARWDLDKTYLRTEFDTVRDLVRTAVERPDRKRSVPGAAALLRELGRSGAHIHILSGSPRQMKGRLVEKLLIDRVRWDELTLKPNLSNLARLRLRAMRDQLGYKLPALLTARVRDQTLAAEADQVREVLVGDDAEADAFVYSLYADLCAGLVTRHDLTQILARGRLYADQVEGCLAAFDRLHRAPVVRRILIHLDRQSPPSRFEGYGPRVVPFFNYFQAAFVMMEDGVLDLDAMLRVGSELVSLHRFDAEALGRSYLDLLRRGHVSGRVPDGLSEACARVAERSGAPGILQRTCELITGYARQPESARAEATVLDYIQLADQHRGGRNRRRH